MGLKDFIIKTYRGPKKRPYQSVWTAVLGPNQSGKTDFNLLQMEMIHDLGLGVAFGSNMPLKADFEIDFIEDFQTLKNRCKMLNPDPERYGIKRYFFFGSEMGKWLPRDQPWENVKFITELQLVRKYGLNFLGDGIARIDSRVLNEKHFHGYFEKVNKARPQIAVYYDWINRRKVMLKGIPRTTIKFDTWYSANFFMNPQVPDDAVVPLNPEHQIVRKYLEHGSWKNADIHPQEGKRAVEKVLRFHMKECLHTIQEPVDEPVDFVKELRASARARRDTIQEPAEK